jgi:hypothetical protein
LLCTGVGGADHGGASVSVMPVRDGAERRWRQLLSGVGALDFGGRSRLSRVEMPTLRSRL